MIIRLYDIDDESELSGVTDGSRFLRPEDSDVAFVKPIEWALRLRKMGKNLHVSGPVAASLRLACARCLEDFTFNVGANLDIELVPREGGPVAEELELTRDDMNLNFYEGDEIDLDPYIYEEVMINLPIKALCAEACKGMCPICGTNLNVSQCRCERETGTVLGDKLRQFLKES